MSMSPNDYSSTWYAMFSQGFDPSQTAREIEFLAAHLPIGQFPRVLDLCCGEGRHSLEMAKKGYAVTGIDKNEASIEAATSCRQDGAEFMAMDARDIGNLGRPWDAVICMWQSFGYFGESKNRQLLADLRLITSPDARLILDIYNADFFRSRQGSRQLEKDGRMFTEQKTVTGDRLRVELKYHDSSESDVFDWQIFTPQQMTDMLQAAGWSPIIACEGFDPARSPSADCPRMQVVAERMTDPVSRKASHPGR